jgi:UrcA family protein
MRTSYRIALATAVVVTAALVAAGTAAAPGTTEVTVAVPRVVKSDAGRPGAPYDVTLTGHVSYADLDLAKTADAAALEQRVRDKALAICEQIGKDYPAATPSRAECAKLAADRAMVQVRKAIGVAAKAAR